MGAVLTTATLVACGPKLPTSHADPEAVTDWRDPLSRHPTRRRVHALHVACHEQVEAVHETVRDRRLTDALYVALSVALYAFLQALPVMDEDAASAGNEAALTGPGGHLDYRCTDQLGDNPSHGGCNPPILPTLTFDDEGTLRTNRPRDDDWSPARRIHTINAAVDAMDDFLFSHPDPSEWSEEQREAFEDLAVAMENTCRR